MQTFANLFHHELKVDMYMSVYVSMRDNYLMEQLHTQCVRLWYMSSYKHETYAVNSIDKTQVSKEQKWKNTYLHRIITGTGFKAFGPFLMPLLWGEVCMIDSFLKSLSYIKKAFLTQNLHTETKGAKNHYLKGGKSLKLG